MGVNWKSKSGFTLIELLAVIVILAIILAIAVPSISNMISASTKSAFESNAKLVLKAANYKKLENDSFDETELNKDNISTLLGLSSDNYESVNIIREDGNVIISIVGKGKWNGLVACGTFQNMKVVSSLADCSSDLISPVITINGDATVSINQGDTYVDLGATATDNKDGDITSKITVTSNVNPNVPGTYTVTYNVTDAAGNKGTLTRTVTVVLSYAGPSYINSKNVNGPVLTQGMTPIKWDGTNWVTTTASDDDWYNYNTTDKKWANAKTKDGSMWVWIPRYVYKITSGWHSNTTGTIDIQFSMGTDDTRGGTVTLDTGTTSNASNNKWTNHPAFTFGTTELTGIWVAKFEASAAEGVANGYTYDGLCPTAGDNVSTKTIKVQPNIVSWRCQSAENAFIASRNMETNSVYGWGTTGNNIDTHLMKNSEWGAIAYLSKSQYGKNVEEIYLNNNSDYVTGCSAGTNLYVAGVHDCSYTYETANGVKASTTGNIYGIYDMVGSAWEIVSAYIDNGSTSLTTSGTAILNAGSKYKDVYTKGTTDDQESNYALTINKKGDALYETGVAGTYTNAWYTDMTLMPYTLRPWFIRGGEAPDNTAAGIFSFDKINGRATTITGFRPVLIVNAGL